MIRIKIRYDLGGDKEEPFDVLGDPVGSIIRDLIERFLIEGFYFLVWELKYP